MASHMHSILGGGASSNALSMLTGSGATSTLAAATTADSRLLNNLIKAEKSFISHLASSVNSAHQAAAALSSWGTSEAPDIAEASSRIAHLLSAAADLQQTHVAAIEGYRVALKDVADREASIRSVVRDRDILVSRLIKASKSSKKTPEEKAERVAVAQRELQACEEVLAQEQAALVGVKRRTFKEALSMRMKTMGDAGAAMVDAAKESLLLLNDFDSGSLPATMGYDAEPANSLDGAGYEQGEEQDEGRAVSHPAAAVDNNSVTPSQSASQVNQRPAGYNPPFRGNRIGEESEDADAANRVGEDGNDSDSDDGRGWNPNGGVPAPHHLPNDPGVRTFVPTLVERGNTALPSPAPTPPRKDSKRERIPGAISVPMPPVPTARRVTHDGWNLMPVPTAPRPTSTTPAPRSGSRASQRSVDAAAESSSDEDARPTVAHHNAAMSPPTRRRRQSVDDSSSAGGTARAPGTDPKRASFLGRVGKLFKTELGEGAAPQDRQQEALERRHSEWHTRTDTNLRTSSALSLRETGGGAGARVSRRQSLLRQIPGSKAAQREEPDSSDEEDQRDLVRHVNPRMPLWQGEKASSDVGGPSLTAKLNPVKRLQRTPSAMVTVGPLSLKARQEEEERLRVARQSVIGSGFVGGAPAAKSADGGGVSASGTIKKKKKKSKPPSVAGSEVGTGPTRTRPTSVVVAGDASSLVRRSDSVRITSGNASLGRSDSVTGSVRSKASKKKRGSVLPGADGGLGSMSPQDGSGKFSTSSWVAKAPGSDAGVGQGGSAYARSGRTAADFVANAGLVPHTPRSAAEIAASTTGGGNTTVTTSTTTTTTTVPLAAPQARRAGSSTSPAPSGAALTQHGSHVPQPSRTMSPPPKSALKPGSASIDRSNSVSSAATGAAPPVLPAPMAAPPPASSLLQSATLNAAAKANNETVAPTDAKQQSSAASVLSLGEDKRFDGTGSLDVGFKASGAGGEQANGKATADSKPDKGKQRESVPRLDMPPSEPFKLDLDSQGKPRRPSAADAATPTSFSHDSELMTPGEAAALSTFLASESAADATDASKAKKPAEAEPPRQPPGVTRVTVASTRLQPSRTYGPGAPADSSDSSDAGASSARTATAAQTAASPAAPVVNRPPSALAAPKAALSIATSDTSAEGSGLGRRKSVRMAPDVKLPPETPPPHDGPSPLSRLGSVPRAPGSTTTVNMGPVATAPGSALSTRLAPPPAAPPRLPKKDEVAPIDLAAPGGRERVGWTTRIGQTNPDDSSSDDDDQDGGGAGHDDDYASARRAFGTASRHWGKATGAIRPRKKSTTAANTEANARTAATTAEPTAAATTTTTTPSASPSKTKTKKKKGNQNFGYNPAVPLPASMEVVGRSGGGGGMSSLFSRKK